jgi:hypothetical protein
MHGKDDDKQTYKERDVTCVTNRCQLNTERLVVLSDCGCNAECCPGMDQFWIPGNPSFGLEKTFHR